MTSNSSLQRDRVTLEAIGAIFCEAHHQGAIRDSETGLCAECAEVVDYAMTRTEKCPYNHEGNCQDCNVHCYNGDMRLAVKEMMRYSAPRMIYKHPWMTFRYAKKKLNGHK